MPLIGAVTAIYFGTVPVSRVYAGDVLTWDSAGVVQPGLFPRLSLFPSLTLFPSAGSAGVHAPGAYGAGVYGAGPYGGD